MRILGLFLSLLACVAVAQAPAPTVEVDTRAIAVTLDVQPRSFTLPQTLTITWSAPAPATSCVASGQWSGTKAISGTEQVAGVVGESTFGLTCSGAVPPVTLEWQHPTQNTDGSNYTDPKHTEVYRASSAAGLPTATAIAVPYPQRQYIFTGLLTGAHHFATKAVNLAGAKSAMSASTSSDVQAPTGTATPVTVTGSTAPPTGVVSISGDGYAVKPNENLLDYVLDGIVGTVQLGAPCDVLRQMGATNYYAINRAQYVTWTTSRRPKTVVVQCAAPQGATVESEAAPLEEDGG